ncbi:hypothetical protein B5P43_15595 [Bacillus sp. SRB_336]|nr:hypothetical protein B5P43_15595 [Bacillus sp. SRB_336]
MGDLLVGGPGSDPTATSAHMVDMTKILTAGDWHGNTRWAEFCVREAAKAGYKTILHVGDLAVLWPSGGGPQTEDRFTMLLKRWLEQYDLRLLFADGNHDVHPRLRALPLNAEGFGVISDRLLYAPRGHRWEIEGVRFGALGGAVSIDQAHRKAGLSWWPEEAITTADVERLGHETLDVLITHEVPAGVQVTSGWSKPLPEHLAYACYEQRRLVAEAVANTKPQFVFSGHWHQRVTQRLSDTDTTVHVLNMDGGGPGNLVSLDLGTMTVEEF